MGVAWEKRAGKQSARGAGPIQCSNQKEVVVQFTRAIKQPHCFIIYVKTLSNPLVIIII
jgi:hypothetical protein